jgi:hypothetical protein
MTTIDAAHALATLTVAVAAAACGGARREPVRAVVAAPPPADAAVAQVEPQPDAPPPDPCGVYALAVRGPLARIGRAGDLFLEQARARAEPDADPGAHARNLAAFADAIDDERRVLATIRVGDERIDRVHAGLDPALGALSAALRVAVEPTDAEKAARRFVAAVNDYQAAVAAIRRVCPAVE